MFDRLAAGGDTLYLRNMHLETGHEYVLTVTGTDQNCVLEFQHGDDETTWFVHPGWSGVHTGGVIVGNFRCNSGRMRLKFAANVGADVLMSAVAHVGPGF